MSFSRSHEQAVHLDDPQVVRLASPNRKKADGVESEFFISSDRFAKVGHVLIVVLERELALKYDNVAQPIRGALDHVQIESLTVHLEEYAWGVDGRNAVVPDLIQATDVKGNGFTDGVVRSPSLGSRIVELEK